MTMRLKNSLLAFACAMALATPALAKDLTMMGISVGSLGNPFFVALGKGAESAARKLNPDVKVTIVASDYDLNKQANQIDSFVAAGAELILLDAADPQALTGAIKRAQAAGVIVVGVDERADGEDAVVMTDNVKAGELACQEIVDRLGGKGDIVILNGPQVSSVVARIKGCDAVLAKAPGIKVLSRDQDAKGSRDGGLNVMQGLLTRFPKLDAAFTINDPTAIGASLAMKQLGRTEFFITSVDGSPDIEAALKDPSTKIVSSSSQDPYVMAQRGVEVGYEIMQGKRPAEPIQLMTPKLVTPENVGEYQGWTAER